MSVPKDTKIPFNAPPAPAPEPRQPTLILMKCPNCGGTGSMYGHNCSQCFGNGTIFTEKGK
jgi:hypothetical protein